MLDLRAPVVVVPVEMAGRSPCGRAGCHSLPTGGFRLEAAQLAAGVGPLFCQGPPAQVYLLLRLGVRAGHGNGAPLVHEHARGGQTVEQRAVVRYEQARPPILGERARHQIAGVGIKVVRGLVERKEHGIGRQGACYLDSLALAVRQRVEAPQPRVVDAEQVAQAHGLGPVVAGELLEARGRSIRRLGTEQASDLR